MASQTNLTSEARANGRGEQIDKYIEDIESGRTFALHAAGARSSFGYRPPINRRDWSTCIERLARMASESDQLAQLAHAIIHRVNLYGTDPQCKAAVYDAAFHALAAGFDDVIGRAAPDAGRYSDHQHQYSLRTRVALHHWLEYACRPFADSVPGVGWCLAAIAEEIAYYPPREMQVS